MTPSRGLPVAHCSTITTRGREAFTEPFLMKPEVELSLNLSVNSHSQKRRRFAFSPVVDIGDEDQRSNVIDVDCMRRRIEFSNGNETTPRILKDIAADSVSSISTTEKKFQISCSVCRSYLGLPQNNQCVNGSLSFSSKVHLARLLDGENQLGDVHKVAANVRVLATDTLLIDPLLLNRDATHQEGTWCEEDGCVFKSIFCPFCTCRRYCLGVQIMATDTTNTNLLDKVLPPCLQLVKKFTLLGEYYLIF